MAVKKNRKKRKTPNYGFLYKWQPTDDNVKGESGTDKKRLSLASKNSKSADILAQQAKTVSFKKDLIKSLTIISLLLILELVIYLALNRFG
jgi:hypothetical protein